MNQLRLPSKLYGKLYQKGGDRLIAVYCLLRMCRDKKKKYYPFTSGNNMSVQGYGLLRKQTPISLSVLKKEIPVLIGMGLCRFDQDGGFEMLGNRKLKQLYNEKLIPVGVGKNLRETELFCFHVRVFSSQTKQQKMIKKKKFRSEAIFKSKNPRTLAEYKLGQKIIKKFGEKIDINDNTVLSNQGFADLKASDNKTKSSGHYWKKKLLKQGLVTCNRRFSKIRKMSFPEYVILKKNRLVLPNQTYIRGYLSTELVSNIVVYTLKENSSKRFLQMIK